ncbi:hypothetical protein JCM33374_g2222 [Metschnikowia sp. JCM 33374]|nr:hypothetical protein JCM33374_g2222 [Metschnikowia sp. JCM 33374]
MLSITGVNVHFKAGSVVIEFSNKKNRLEDKISVRNIYARRSQNKHDNTDTEDDLTSIQEVENKNSKENFIKPGNRGKGGLLNSIGSTLGQDLSEWILKRNDKNVLFQV